MIPNSMFSAKFLGNEKIDIVETSVPEPGTSDVLLKTSYCALCGSDKRLFHRGAKVTPGHELTGVVVKNGPGVDVPLGTRAAVYIQRFCGTCDHCRAGMTNRCISATDGLVGWQTDGGYAQYLVVPAANLILLPDDISDADGVLLLDTIGTAAYGIKYCMSAARSDIVFGSAAVIGCGPLGLGSLLVLSGLGWTRTAAYDPNQQRLGVAVSWGVDAIDPEDAAISSRYALVVEASGHPAARAMALDIVAPGGAVLLLGENDDPWTITPSPKLRRKDCAYIRSFYFPLNQAEENMALFRASANEYREMIAHRAPLGDLEVAFSDFCAGKTLKPIVRPNMD
jgi:threonine dehydrogenase-like Zn-dependent dehydrogenase